MATIKTEADAPTDDEMKALLAELTTDPDEFMRSRFDSLTPAQVAGLQRGLNIYSRLPAVRSDRKRAVIASYTNPPEDFHRRHAVTTVAAFLHQMAREYEAPQADRQWSPRDADASAMTAAELADALGAAADLARGAQADAAAAAEAEAAAADEDARAAGEAATGKGDAAVSRDPPGHAPGEARPPTAAERAAAARADAAALRRSAAVKTATAAHAAWKIGAGAGPRLAATYRAAAATDAAVAEFVSAHPPPAGLEAPPRVAAAIIGGFLRSLFEFDPVDHVRDAAAAVGESEAERARRVAAGLPDPGDPSRPSVAWLRARPTAAEVAARAAAAGDADLAALAASQARLNALWTLATEAADDAGLLAAAGRLLARGRDELVQATATRSLAARPAPPQDVFHRLSYFAEVNYEELRALTRAYYPDWPALDFALGVWEVIEGTDDELAAKFSAFAAAHGEELPFSLKRIDLGAWTLLGDFKAARDRIEFLNGNTEPLRRIFDRLAEDKKIGADLMKKRVAKAKAANIAADGPDAPGLAGYRAAAGAAGARALSAEESARLEAARGDLRKARELEVLDQALAEIARIEAIAPEKVTPDDAFALKEARARAARAREMLEVPDDAVRVGVIRTDAGAGTVAREHFYSAADSAGAGPA